MSVDTLLVGLAKGALDLLPALIRAIRAGKPDEAARLAKRAAMAAGAKKTIRAAVTVRRGK